MWRCTQGFQTPTYNGQDGILGSSFGLNYNSRNGSETRSELGAFRSSAAGRQGDRTRVECAGRLGA